MSILSPGNRTEQPVLSKLFVDFEQSENNNHFELSVASQGQNGFEKIRQAQDDGTPFALAFIDIRMPPGWDGIKTAREIRNIDPWIEIVMITGYSDCTQKEIVETVGSPEKLLFIRKPVDTEEITQLALSLTCKWNLYIKEKSQRNFLSAILDASPAAIFTTDAQCRVHFWSKTAEQITDYSAEEVEKFPCIISKIIISPNDCKMVCHLFCSENQAPQELQIKTKSGKERIIAINAKRSLDLKNNEKWVIAFWDITENKEMEFQQRQKQKMEALGTLAGGVAHDLNNMLTPIMGYSELLRIKLSDNPPVQKYLKGILECTDRATNLIKHILAFSRKQDIEVESLDLNSLISEFSKILKRLLREDIILQYHLAADLWPISCDRSQIEQVLMNLIVNARDAVLFNKSVSKNQILVETYNETIETPILDIAHNIIQGDNVVFKVQDNGVGMDKETAALIFDPFFTTKKVGNGTGIGLSTVHGVINKHKGHIRLETSLAEGATFFIYFPRAKECKTVHNTAQKTMTNGGNEKILIVEDSQDVRQMSESILTELGYSVVSSENGVKALEILKQDIMQYDLLLTDLIMPELNGLELASQTHKLRPQMPVIFMTSYGFDSEVKNMGKQHNIALLSKPFNIKELSHAVRSLLDEQKHSG